MIIWGDKYGADTVNRLTNAVVRRAETTPRFVLLSDRQREGLDNNVVLRTIPAEWLTPEMRSTGCLAKLAMFARGVVPDDLPAIYLDLDTVILGDVGQGLRHLHRNDGLLLLQSAILPFGPLGRLASLLTKKRRYARGNSSVVIYHPAHCDYIASEFMALKKQYPAHDFHSMRADERFMSWAAQDVVAAVPRSFAVKFPTEYMSRIMVLSYLWAIIPWVRARRRGLVAVTLCGETAKPEALLSLPQDGRLTDRRGRKLIWSESVLGHVKPAILEFYNAENSVR